MKILFLNAYFAPEITAFTHLEQDLMEGLIAAGHEIEVLTPTPTRGITKAQAKAYKGKKREILYDGKLSVRRFWAPREGRNPIMRALRYFWCNFREKRLGKKYKGVDVIFAVSTPPIQGLLAGKLSKKLKCPFVYSLQDIFPDSLVTTGLTKEGSFAWKMGKKIENKTYNYADKIVVISQSCKQNLLNKGVSEEKLALISNWVDVDSLHLIDRESNSLLSEFSIDKNKFLVVYAGNFGKAQGAEIVLRAAQTLREQEEIQFVVFGGGSGFEEAVRYVQENQLRNVFIHKLLPQDRVAEVYSLGDVALITCKAGVSNSGMPSKLWSIMACNTPIIASFDTNSDLAEVLRVSGAGECVEPENVEALSRAINSAYKNKEYREEISFREYVKKVASKESCVEKYVELICVR